VADPPVLPPADPVTDDPELVPDVPVVVPVVEIVEPDLKTPPTDELVAATVVPFDAAPVSKEDAPDPDPTCTVDPAPDGPANENVAGTTADADPICDALAFAVPKAEPVVTPVA
jgi:hypothetical protein